MSQTQPQYEDDIFISCTDCDFCGRILGMQLRKAWASSIDVGIMNTQSECRSCHRRKWERIALPKVLENEQDTSSSAETH